VSHPHDPAEVEADRVADAVVAGRSASVAGRNGPQVNRSIRDRMRAVAARATTAISRGARTAVAIAREPRNYWRARQAERQDGGHSLERHGPQVSDAELQTRLRTGQAPEGLSGSRHAPVAGPNANPTQVGTASRFDSYGLYLETRQAAATLYATGLGNTRALLGPLITAYRNATTAWITASKPGGVNNPSVKGPKDALKAARDGIGTLSATMIPVELQAKGSIPATSRRLHCRPYSTTWSRCVRGTRWSSITARTLAGPSRAPGT
jgi:hypothetical protein